MALLIVRLLLPWAPESPLSVYNWVHWPSQAGQSLEQRDAKPATVAPQQSAGSAGTETVQAPLPAAPARQPADRSRPSAATALSWVWLAGAVAMGVYAVAVNRRFALRIAKASLMEDGTVLAACDEGKEELGIRSRIPFVETGMVRSPTLYGLLRPRILLPDNILESLTREELGHIFLHELAHFKRRDKAVNWLMHLLLILHWFNPLLWYAYYRMRQDQELACDAYVLSRLSPGGRREYGHTVIRVLENLSGAPLLVASATGVAGTRWEARKRITMIKLFRKSSWKWAAVGGAVLLLVGAATLTNARVGVSDAGAPPVFGRTIAEALVKGGRNVSLILAQEKTGGGVLVFYLPQIGGDRASVQSELGMEYLQQLRGWKMSFQGGEYSSGIEQKLYGEFLPDDGVKATPLPLFYGEVKDPSIKSVSVTDVQKGEEKQARVIVAGREPGLGGDMRLWYATLDQPGGDTYQITGKGDQGQVLFAETVNVQQGSSSGTVQTEAAYTNAAYYLTLQYPAAWQKDPRYDERYGGSDGFFALGAAAGEGRTIDQVADGEARHKLRPYGSNPQITKVEVSGQEGRLVLPADDQPKEMENQAVVVVQSPAPIRLGGEAYHYVLLYADRQHIEDITRSLRFTVPGGPETPAGAAAIKPFAPR